ncbi:MAG: hypothetical protein ACI8V4_003510, partial [Ilumatobacter sp.]
DKASGFGVGPVLFVVGSTQGNTGKDHRGQHSDGGPSREPLRYGALGSEGLVHDATVITNGFRSERLASTACRDVVANI